MSLLSAGARRTLSDNKWRYLSMAAGFVLFVAPFALFTRLIYAIIGNTANATLHSVCFRMPVDWVFGGRFNALWGSVAAAFVLGVVVLSYFVGPLFCGWLCPLGSIGEALSRWLPGARRFRLRIRDSQVTSAMRWGFMAGFVLISVLIGYRIAPGVLGSICCRFCNASVLQNCAWAAVGDPEQLGYWSSGSILAAGGWLLAGGALFAGGRGWCLFFCPLGALSGAAHRLGAWRGLLATRFDKTRCKECVGCLVTCPTGAIRPDGMVQTDLCVNCYECTHACISGAYRCSRAQRN